MVGTGDGGGRHGEDFWDAIRVDGGSEGKGLGVGLGIGMATEVEEVEEEGEGEMFEESLADANQEPDVDWAFWGEVMNGEYLTSSSFGDVAKLTG